MAYQGWRPGLGALLLRVVIGWISAKPAMRFIMRKIPDLPTIRSFILGHVVVTI
jgi:hypothetical protein